MHVPLKGTTRVHESKWHFQPFKEPKGRDDRRLGDGGRVHWKLVVPGLKVYNTKHSTSSNNVHCITDKRYRITVRYSY